MKIILILENGTSNHPYQNILPSIDQEDLEDDGGVGGEDHLPILHVHHPPGEHTGDPSKLPLEPT